MIKLIALMKAKQEMTRDAFIERYERCHAPLIVDSIPFFTGYRRSYPARAMAPHHIEGAPLPDYFDVVTELWYADQAAINRQVSALGGRTGETIAADEEEQFDRSQMMMFAADEHVTPMAVLRPCPVDHQGPPPIRAIGLLRKRPNMSRDEFIAYYETNHVRLALDVMAQDGVPLFANYTRSYPSPGSSLRIGTGGEASQIDFDVITDMWFWTDADYRTFLARPQNPAIGKALVADEIKLFDRGAMQAFVADEFITPADAIQASVMHPRPGGFRDVET